MDVDVQLCGYVKHVWEEGDPKGWVANAMSGIIHFEPGIRWHLHGARRLLKAWGKAEVCSRAPPLSTDFAVALAGVCIELKNLRLAVLILVAFHAFLRTGELLHLQAKHFMMSERGGLVLLLLESTKSGQRRSMQSELVVLSDPLLLAYVRCLIPRLAPGERLYLRGSQQFREDFGSLCRRASLPSLPWRPYSLRRGGPTAHFLEYGSLDKTALRGRWPLHCEKEKQTEH